MTDRLEEIQIVFMKRNARKRGPTSSDQLNDMINEIAHDFTAFNEQWNDRLIPLQNTLPNGTEGLSNSFVDAFTDGLDGKTLFVDSRATASNNASYFNTSAERPNTVFEQLADVYTQISSLEEDLENQISNKVLTAEQISVIDNESKLDSTNVENALLELKDQIDTFSSITQQQYLCVRRTVNGSNDTSLRNIFSSTSSGGTIVEDISNDLTWGGADGIATIKTAGIYEIIATCYLDSGAASTFTTLNIEVNGTAEVAAAPAGNGSGLPLAYNLTIIRSLDVSDTIEVNAQHASGTIPYVGSTLTIKRIV